MLLNIKWVEGKFFLRESERKRETERQRDRDRDRDIGVLGNKTNYEDDSIFQQKKKTISRRGVYKN